MAKKVITITIGKRKTSLKADNVSLRDLDTAQAAIKNAIDRIRADQLDNAIEKMLKED